MHIMEGYLPPAHAIGWSVAAVPFLVHGLLCLRRARRTDPESGLLLGAAGGFSFVLSALKLPSVTGSCSHPTGIGLGAILFGPGPMVVLGTVVLLFQALLLAHGGLTTLGANAVSMAVVGSWTAWGVHRGLAASGVRPAVRVFAAASVGNLATYVAASLQLALAFPDPVSGFAGAAAKFLAVFALTQIPLALAEGFLTVAVLSMLRDSVPDSLQGRIPALQGGRP